MSDTDTIHEPFACAGSWTPYPDEPASDCAAQWVSYPQEHGVRVWACADDCPADAEHKTTHRARIVTHVMDCAQFMTPAERRKLAQQITEALTGQH
jgi:hypothetical protein